MTDMIFLRPRARRRIAVPPAIREAVRLRAEVIRTAAGVRAYAGELRDEVERIAAAIDDGEDSDGH